jgi:ribonuclease HI
MYDPEALKIYIDGSALRNPGPGGLAGIVEYPEPRNLNDETIFQVGYEMTTNNRMELRAFIKSLEYVITEVITGIARVIVVTDSLYVYENRSRVIYWRRNGWVTREGRPIENIDLWRRVLSLEYKLHVRVDLHWLKGKTTPITKLVDLLAKQASKNSTEPDVGFMPGRISRPTSSGVATSFPAGRQVHVIRVYRHNMRRRGGGSIYKVFFELFSEKEGTLLGKYYAYSQAENLMHRHHWYRVEFNNNLKYPGIINIEEV